MKDITITISKCPTDEIGDKFKDWWKETYLISYKGEMLWEVAPNFRISRLVDLIKEKENSL